jgi:hypothetical protein
MLLGPAQLQPLSTALAAALTCAAAKGHEVMVGELLRAGCSAAEAGRCAALLCFCAACMLCCAALAVVAVVDGHAVCGLLGEAGWRRLRSWLRWPLSLCCLCISYICYISSRLRGDGGHRAACAV